LRIFAFRDRPESPIIGDFTGGRPVKISRYFGMADA